jgi:CDP-diacylglycerol--serine O-phosphatidyltransferase
VPTPANAMIICSFPLILHFQPDLIFLVTLINSAWFLIVLSVVMSYLLISELPLFALKFKNFGWADNKIRFVFLGLALVMLIALKFVAIPIIIILYILISIVNNIFLKNKV